MASHELCRLNMPGMTIKCQGKKLGPFQDRQNPGQLNTPLALLLKAIMKTLIQVWDGTRDPDFLTSSSQVIPKLLACSY